jgi:hypothetical protein
MNNNRYVGDIPYCWFFAEVIDVMDPDMLGQVKIRINGFHDAFEDKDLPWAAPVLPITSASYQRPEFGEVGVSPTGILVGSFVFGFFADGPSAKVPVVMGTMPTIKQNDPKLHDVSPLAREVNQWENKPLLGPEPPSTYAALYPQNKVKRTISGHVIELDDTQGAERIHIYHKSGTYVEISADGRTVTKVTGNNFVIHAQNDEIHVQGNVHIHVVGNVTMEVDQNIKAQVGKNFEMQIGGTCKIQSGGAMTLIGSKIDLNP